MANRRTARQVALQALYWVESSGDPIELAVADLAQRENLPEHLQNFALRLCRNVLTDHQRFDEMIASAALNWKVSRIGRIERIALRIGLAELFGSEEIPPKVSINEAIELSRAFSGEKAVKFVNGILDAIAKREGIIKSEDESEKMKDK
ncbi:MAG: transcription antitermination factor NusB, partial [Candidatus Latescibacteria bacterium]|nr:transcription antitermination factor NusB [Candidatus Latescibacterota bacterium]